MRMGRMGVRFLEDGREWKLPGFLYADDLVLCGELEEELRMVVEQFVQVCRRRRRKVNASKSKVIAMNGEEGLECEVHVAGTHLEHVPCSGYQVTISWRDVTIIHKIILMSNKTKAY